MVVEPAFLLKALQTAGVATSAQLQSALGASQATVSRALAPLLEAGQVLRIGRGRAQAYLLPRAVEGVGPSTIIPIVKIDETGRPSPFAEMVPVAGGRFWIDEEAGPSALHDGLPWFLADMRPQGFIGRTFAHTHAALGLAPNPDHWSDDDVLRALCLAGEDLPGNLVIGAPSFERLQALHPKQTAQAHYPRLAEAALQGMPGSSAGGDQPKFCTVHKGRPVIVKFSPAGHAAADQRWRDLLVCEHLALETLAGAGVPAAQSRITQGEGRVFLEVVRFDRTAKGRVGMVSLMAYDSEYVGKIDNWGNTAGRMASRNLLTDSDADRLRFLEAFGILIGNTDRHYGNISLLIDGQGDWALAPAYDMLPMVYAPTAGELVVREFEPGAIAPPVQVLREWPAARLLAHAYWKTVAADSRISAAFRKLASAHARALR
ncbi:MAG: type II toxin-antitoxin system HipA family toxin YjjJ [Burkholderiales bacterium]|nr:type II toxin-antitoxin system HipA family toxin YjjJ [Burkholderiales bacterium]